MPKLLGRAQPFTESNRLVFAALAPSTTNCAQQKVDAARRPKSTRGTEVHCQLPKVQMYLELSSYASGGGWNPYHRSGGLSSLARRPRRSGGTLTAYQDFALPRVRILRSIGQVLTPPWDGWCSPAETPRRSRGRRTASQDHGVPRVPIMPPRGRNPSHL